MSGLDKIRVPENRRWALNLMIAVLTVLGLMVSASWWTGSTGRFAIAAIASCLIGWALSVATLRRLRARRTPRKDRRP